MSEVTDPNKPPFDPNQPYQEVNEGKPPFDPSKPFDVGEPEKKKKKSNGSSSGTNSDSAPANGSSDIKPIDFTIKSPTDLLLETQAQVNQKADAKIKAREQQLTASYNDATKPLPEDDAEIESRLNQERNKSGFVNNSKKVGAFLGDYFNELVIKPVNQALTMFGDTTREDIDNNKGIIPLLDDRAAAPFEAEIKQVKIDARKRKEKLSPEEINSRAEKLFADKERLNLYIDRANSYLDDLSQDDKKILELDRYDDIKNLNESTKKKLAVQSALKLDFKNTLDDYNEIKSEIQNLHKNKQPIPQDLLEKGIGLENNLKNIAETSSKNYDSLVKDRSDLGTAEQEYDLFRRENRDWANFGKNILVSGGELVKGIHDFDLWIKDMVGIPTTFSHLQSEDAKEFLAKQRDKLRKPVDSIESVEGFINYASDLVANQLPILAATSTGGGGLAVIGASSAGQKYADMNDEVMSGKATYTPMQMAVAPLLYGGAEVISELPTYSILKKGGRVLSAVENSAPELLKKTAKQKAIEWAKDYGIDMTKELAGEEFTQFAQNFNDKYVLGKSDVGLLDGTGRVFKDTFTLTSILKTVPHVAGVVVRPFQTKDELGQLDENSKQIIQYANQLKTEGITETEKATIQKQIDKLTTSSSKIMANTINKVGTMPDELYDEILSLNKKAGELKSQAQEIDLDGKIENKDNLLNALRQEYKDIQGKRQDIVEGRTTVVDVLPIAEQDKLKRQALEDLVTELNPDGSKDMVISNKQILDRANEIYSESKANENQGKVTSNSSEPQKNGSKIEGNLPQKENRIIEYTDGGGKKAILNTKDIEFTFDKNRFLFTENGNRIGHIELGPQNGNEVSVKLSGIFNPSLNRKGIGTIMYKDVANYLKDKYNLNLVSDTERSADSEALWKKLEREGLATKEGDFYKYNHEGETTGTVAADGDVQPGNGTENPQGKDDGLQTATDSGNDTIEIKPKSIKVGNYNYEYVKNEWVATDNKGNQKVEEKGKRFVPEKALEKHAEKFDFTKGKKAIENSNDVTTETYSEDVAKYSQNPAEVAEELGYVRASDATEGLDHKSVAIAEVLGEKSVEPGSFNRFGDRNNINRSIALQYFSKKGKGKGLDQIAMEAEELAYGDYNANDPRVTEQDIVDFINDNPGGSLSFLNSGKKAKIDALKKTFTELTGLPANDKYLEKAIEQQREKEFRFRNNDLLHQLSDEELLTLMNEIDQFKKYEQPEQQKETDNTVQNREVGSDAKNSEGSSEQSTVPGSRGKEAGGENQQSEINISKDSTRDQIKNWLDRVDQNLDKFGKENLSMGIPIVVAKAAIKAMKAAYAGFAEAADIIQAGIDAIKQTEWFRNLSQPEQKDIVNNFETKFLPEISKIELGNSRQAENLMNRAISETISEDDAYNEVKDSFDKARKELENKKPLKEYFRNQYRKFIARFTDRQYVAKRLLDKSGLKNTKNLIINSHGASGKAKLLFEDTYNKIYRKLTVQQRNALDEIIQAKRFIAIDENREARDLPPVSHPNFIDKNKSEKFLSKLKDELGDEVFNDLTKRADEYFKTYKGLLKSMLDNGLISQASYDSMQNVDYQPRVFLGFITDFDGDLETNKRSNNLDSGGLSADQIKSMSEGDANSLVLNSEWLLTNSLLARSKAMAKNNINKRFITEEFPKAKARFDALDPKNLSGDDVRFYKYFKELNSKIIDNPIVAYTPDGNPKFEKDKTPQNFAKMYYYIDGVRHEFFVEKGLHESWNDNIDGFLDADAKEVISYASGAALVKAIATGNNPAFPIVNTPRDFMFTVTFSDQYSKFVPKAVAQVGKDASFAVREMWKKDSDVLKKYFEYGGAMDFLSSQGTLKKETMLGQAVEKAVSPNSRDFIKKWFSRITLHKVSAYSEMMFRLGIFQRSIYNQLKDLGYKDISEVTDKQQRDDIYNQAVSNARGILDFNQGGYITKDLESVIPYVNVAFQGGRIALNALEKDPVGTTSRVLQVATIASSIPVGLSLIMIGANKDDDDDRSAYEIYLHAMDGISKYQKSKYMNIVTGSRNEDGEYRVIKIAKAQELSPVMSITDDIYQNMVRKMAGKPKKSAANITADALFTFNSNVMPVDITSPSGLITRTPIVKGVMTYATGYDFFREQPLSMDIGKVPKSVEGINMNTTEDFYKEIGKNYGLSPIRTKGFVESLITSPDTNPFVGVLYGGADAIASDKDAKEIGKDLAKSIYKSTGKRVISYSSDFNRKLAAREDLQEKIDAIKAENYRQKTEFNQLAKDYINKEVSGKELKEKLKEFEPNDQKRMLNKLKDKVKLKGIDGTILDIKYEQDPEAKAVMIMYYYGNIFDGSEDSKNVYRQMKRADGILTPAVKAEYAKLLKAEK